MLILGSHVHFNQEQLLGSVKEALSYNANTFMFYTGAPQNTVRKPINDNLSLEALKLMKENNIDLKNIICHAPYIVNLANKNDLSKWNFSIDFIKNELSRCENLGITKLVLHPGSAVKITKKEGLDNIIDGLNIILNKNSSVKILLETMAGKGNECGSTLDELKYILDNIKEKNNIGICLDTCHLNDSGIEISHFDDYLKEFDQKIGIDKIYCIHINDSKNIIASHKDRHENIGLGTIGFENLLNVIYHKKLENIPKILETPYIGKTNLDKERLYPPYKFEIEMIKNKKYDSNLLDKVRDFYKN